MNDFLNRFSKAMKKGNVFMLLILILVLAIAASGLYFTFFAKKTAGTGVPANQVESTADENVLVLTDTDGSKYTIPKFKVNPNTYAKNKFEENNGLITYTGGDSYAGIDVSEHQGTIDWAAVKAAGIDFAFIRTSWRGITRGRLNADTQFEANIVGAAENDIKVGVYLYSQATSVQDAEEEATYVISQLSQYKDKISYPVVFDWETDGQTGTRTATVKGEDASKYAAAFCSKIKMAGYKPMVYMNKTLAYNFYNLDVIKEYDFWLAEYEPKPSFYYDFSVWQYSDGATVAGIDGKVDVNISFVDYSR